MYSMHLSHTFSITKSSRGLKTVHGGCNEKGTAKTSRKDGPATLIYFTGQLKGSVDSVRGRSRALHYRGRLGSVLLRGLGWGGFKKGVRKSLQSYSSTIRAGKALLPPSASGSASLRPPPTGLQFGPSGDTDCRLFLPFFSFLFPLISQVTSTKAPSICCCMCNLLFSLQVDALIVH